MDLTPDLLLEAKFAPARRGYDMNEVDDFLERCAEGLDVLLARLKAEFERAERAEDAVSQLQAALHEAEARSTEAPPTEPPPAESTPSSQAAELDDDAETATGPESPAPVAHVEPEPAAVAEPMRILIAAERTAEAAIAEATTEAERIRSEAESVASTKRSEAEALLARSRSEAEAEARKAGEEARRSIEVEVLSLRKDRDALTHDVRSLRRWLDEQRTRLRTTARDLQRLVDDPAALRDLPVPELREETTGEAGDDAPPNDANDANDANTADDDSSDETESAIGDPDPGAGTPPSTATAAASPQGSAGLTIFEDDDHGEPTQAVPAVDRLHVFDDGDETVASGTSRTDSDVLR